jgi:hypothetical protein
MIRDFLNLSDDRDQLADFRQTPHGYSVRGERKYRQRLWYKRVYDSKRPQLRRPEIKLNHGAAWKTLISAYISVIPLIGDEPCIAMQRVSGWPLKKAVNSAMMANAGAAARQSQPDVPGAAWPPRHVRQTEPHACEHCS